MKQTVLRMALQKNQFIIKALKSQKLRTMKGTAVLPYTHKTISDTEIKLNKNRIHIANNTLWQIKKRHKYTKPTH
jgi:hypothetical protein